MKKTLLALTVAALTAGSAQAYKFDIKETGTEIDFNGSLRLKWENTNSKVTDANSSSNSNTKHQAVRNNGSRFGFNVKQNLGGDFYALGAVQWRLRGDAPSQHDFDHIYTRQLYAGFGHKQYGELVYGNMTTITDSVKQTDLPNTYSLSDGLLNDASRRVVQYTYKGNYENGNKVKFGVYYGGSSKRDNTNLNLEDHRKNVWGTGLIYTHQIDELQSLTFGTGFSRERFANHADNSAYNVTAYAFDTSYRFDKTVLGLDLERRVTKGQVFEDSTGSLYSAKTTENEIRAVALQEMNEDWNIYAMFAYKTNKRDGKAETIKKNQVMLGTEYYVYKDNIFKVKPFVEGQVLRTRNVGYEKDVKQRDYKAVVGLRIYW